MQDQVAEIIESQPDWQKYDLEAALHTYRLGLLALTPDELVEWLSTLPPDTVEYIQNNK